MALSIRRGARAGETEWEPQIHRLPAIAQVDTERSDEQQKAPPYRVEGLFV